MRRSNRTLNRVILALVGLVLLAGAALAAWPAARAALVAARASALPAGAVPPAPPRIALDASVLWSVAGGCAVVIVLALVWVLSRGRGATRTVLREERVDTDVRVVRDLLARGLERHPSVVGVDASGHVLRGRTAVALRVRARRGTELPALAERIRAAIAELDATLGRPLPLLVRIVPAGRERRAD